MLNFDELMNRIKKAYAEDIIYHPFSYCEGMIYALEIIGNITKEESEIARNKNLSLANGYRFDNRDE